MMKNLIWIESGEKYGFDTAEELVSAIIDKEYYKMTDEKRAEKLELKGYANCIQNKIEIIDKVTVNTDIKGKFIVLDEITYILSLLLFNNVVLLEKTVVDIFTKDLDKKEIKDNYIVVNHFAEELLRLYIAKKF